ncbi:hypothetical protein C8Q70DRAFT_964640 [Cubamyces menziesii]|nr:hypothetical protein C8Q70DRAFT_1030429 [Cubamyces menziesii]KAI0655882.1 hypothetical protein C8Q70DRAFT_1016142 [Cubamyces menziesii]KAI0662334.1 hypothetical protein C8Q70DRAFT_964640 [Cubamyces menziesii]
MHSAFCWSGLTGVMRYAASISKVAAWHPGGRFRIRLDTSSKVPHAVGKASGSMCAFTESMSES